MINLDSLQLINNQVVLFMITLSRFMATFATVSFFRKEFIPIKITILLSAVLTLFLVTYGVLDKNIIPVAYDAIYLNLGMQLFLGFITGFIINIFVDIFLSLGQIISVQSGLGFVNFFVPKVGTITPLSQVFFITAALIFFELNGHLLLIKMIVDSYKLQLLGVTQLDMDVVRKIIMFTKTIFSGALMLSISVLIALLISNITLAIMTKFSPQLNVFSIGINISLIICFFIVYICFDVILQNGKILLNDIMSFANQVMKGIFKQGYIQGP